MSMNRKDVVELTEDLHYAVNLLLKDKVIVLLAQGALPSLLVDNTTALHLAVRRPKNAEDAKKALAILELLLDKGGDINQLVAGRTVMNLAGHNLFWQAVLLIATKKASDAEDKAHYSSALLDVVRFCEEEELLQKLVHTLLEKGAKPDWLNKYDGFNPLHWAVRRGKLFVLRQILNEYPEAYLNKSIETEQHGKSRTPRRMAMKLLLAYEKKPKLSEEEEAAKHRIWQCIVAIGQIAYLPIITGQQKIYSSQLVEEKKIIFRFVCSLPSELMWRAILDGQNDQHPLGELNSTHRIGLIGDTKTIELYKEKELALIKLGYPRVLERRPATPPLSVLRTSPQLFQSAPRIIPDYVGSERQHSPAIPIKPRPTSGLLSADPVGHRSRAHSPSPSPSTSPQEVLAELFGHSPSSHTQDDSPLKGPSRFGSHT